MEMITVLIGKRKFKESSDGSHSAKTEISSRDDKADSTKAGKSSKSL